MQLLAQHSKGPVLLAMAASHCHLCRCLPGSLEKASWLWQHCNITVASAYQVTAKSIRLRSDAYMELLQVEAAQTTPPFYLGFATAAPQVR